MFSLELEIDSVQNPKHPLTDLKSIRWRRKKIWVESPGTTGSSVLERFERFDGVNSDW